MNSNSSQLPIEKIDTFNTKPNNVSLILGLDMSTKPHLVSNKQFVKLQKWMEQFHKEIKSKDDNGDLQLKRLFDVLRKLLRQIVFTKNEDKQLGYLNKVYIWFHKKRKMAKEGKVRTLNVSFDITSNRLQSPLRSFNKAEDDEVKRVRTRHGEFEPREKLQKFDLKRIKLNVDIKNLTTSTKHYISKDTTPTAIRSHFIYYKPRNMREQRMEQFWFNMKNDSVRKKRSSQEFRQAINSWGLAKSRFNENLLRKYENKNLGTRFFTRDNSVQFNGKKNQVNENVDYAKVYNEVSSESEDETPHYSKRRLPIRTKLPEIIDMNIPTIQEKSIEKKKEVAKSVLRAEEAINEADKNHVNYIRKVYGPIINQEKLDVKAIDSIFEAGPKSVKSLSLYNKLVKRPNTMCEIPFRGTPLTHSLDKTKLRISQMKEIINMKEHLARQSVDCDMISLEKAILLPEDKPEAIMTPNNFIQPGSRLIVNPFEVPKKAKKKEKRK